MRKRKILVVLGRENGPMGLLEALAKEGFDVQAAGGFFSALNMAKATLFDLIILDEPRGGPKNPRSLSLRFANPFGQPALLWLGPAPTPHRLGEWTFPLDSFLPKPVKPAEFLARVKSLIRRKPEGVIERAYRSFGVAV